MHAHSGSSIGLDNVDGPILDYSLDIGNPSDTTLIRPAIARVTKLFGKAADLATADRGYWDSTIETDHPTTTPPQHH